MVSCLRSTRFTYPDRSATVFLDLRRNHNLDGGCDAKQFIVTRRTTFGVRMISNKNFSTLNEARKYWIEQATILEDQGLHRMDYSIMNFHEED